MKTIWIAGMATLAMLQGCASIGVDQMTSTGGMITSARGGGGWEETPMKQIKQRDSVVVLTHLKWDPQAGSAGNHAVKWTWYSEDKVVAIREKEVKFDKTPMRLNWHLPAGNFDPGHYRVIVTVDNKIMDTQEYDIVR